MSDKRTSLNKQVVSDMSGDLKESDWKALRQLHAIALERFSGRVLDEIHRITSAADRSAHDRYLDVFRLIQKRDREMADAFDDMAPESGVRATSRHPVA